MHKISIPTPCHEDWSQMTPNELGRHCNACAKTVVDFTHMSDEAVQLYLLSRHGERICGRFSATQLHRIQINLPGNIFELIMPWWKRFLVASLIVFSSTLFSCDVKTNGDILINDSSIQVVPQSQNLSDTANPIQPLFIQPDSLISTGSIGKPVQPVTVRGDIQGDIVIIPEQEPPLIGEPAVVPIDSNYFQAPDKEIDPLPVTDSMIKGGLMINTESKNNENKKVALVGKIH